MELLNKIANISKDNTLRIDELKKLIANSLPTVSTDKNNNLTTHFKSETESKTKIMVCSVIQSAKLFVKKIAGEKIFFDMLNTSDIILTDKEVFKDGTSVGFVRSEYQDGKITKQYIEPLEKDRLKIGDILTPHSITNCKANKLYGNDLSSLIPIKICIELMDNIKHPAKEIHFTLCSSFESATAMANMLNPDYILLIDTSEETEDFKISQGCGVVYKDGCSVTIPMLKNILNEIAVSNDIAHQPYIGRNLKLLETLGISGRGAVAGGLYIPVKHKNSAVQIIDKSDIDNTTQLLKSFLNSNLIK